MVETTEEDSPQRPTPPYPEARMVKTPEWVFREDIGTNLTKPNLTQTNPAQPPNLT